MVACDDFKKRSIIPRLIAIELLQENVGKVKKKIEEEVVVVDL